MCLGVLLTDGDSGLCNSEAGASERQRKSGQLCVGEGAMLHQAALSTSMCPTRLSRGPQNKRCHASLESNLHLAALKRTHRAGQLSSCMRPRT